MYDIKFLYKTLFGEWVDIAYKSLMIGKRKSLFRVLL